MKNKLLEDFSFPISNSLCCKTGEQVTLFWRNNLKKKKRSKGEKRTPKRGEKKKRKEKR